jgi:C-terminal processing protease CtpA/Prc
VRRRARRAILSLVPGELEKETQPDPDPRFLQQAAQLRFRQQILQRLAQNQEAVAKLRAQQKKNRDNLGAAALAAFGVTGETRRQAPLQPGLTVRWIRRGSAAQRLGLRPGDLIVKVNGRATSRPRDFAAVKDWRRVEILVQRNRKYLYLPPRAARK